MRKLDNLAICQLITASNIGPLQKIWFLLVFRGVLKTAILDLYQNNDYTELQVIIRESGLVSLPIKTDCPKIRFRLVVGKTLREVSLLKEAQERYALVEVRKSLGFPSSMVVAICERLQLPLWRYPSDMKNNPLVIDGYSSFPMTISILGEEKDIAFIRHCMSTIKEDMPDLFEECFSQAKVA